MKSPHSYYQVLARPVGDSDIPLRSAYKEAGICSSPNPFPPTNTRILSFATPESCLRIGRSMSRTYPSGRIVVVAVCLSDTDVREINASANISPAYAYMFSIDFPNQMSLEPHRLGHQSPSVLEMSVTRLGSWEPLDSKQHGNRCS